MLAGLAFDLAAELGRSTVCNDTLKDISDEEACLSGIYAVADRVSLDDHVTVGIKDLCVSVRLYEGTAVCKCVISTGHLESCHTYCKTAYSL